MRSGNNMVIVKVDRETNDLIETNIVDHEGNKVELILDTSFDKLKHARISGEVVAVPDCLRDPGMIYYENSPGSPRPATYRSHEKVLRMMASLSAIGRDKAGSLYRPVLFEPDYETICGKEVEVRIGDKIWFHYLCISDNNYIGRADDGMKMYKVYYDQIFGRKSTDGIVMMNGYVMVKPFFGDDFKEVECDGKKINAKTEVLAGVEIVTETVEKPKYLHGILYNIGKPVGKDTRLTCHKGDHIVFTPSSEFTNKIEGDEYYIMRQWDIMAKDTVDGYVPVGNYVSIVPDTYKHKGLIILLEDYYPIANTGVVKCLGENAGEEIREGDRVGYNNAAVSHVNVEGTVFIREEDIMYKYDTNI